MDLLDRIQDQAGSTGLPLVAVTLAAVPCPDTPVILTLHWHGFVRTRLADIPEAGTVAYAPVPSSALQLNADWRDVTALDRAALDAAWELGAWDVQRAERRGCIRPGAEAAEAQECLRAFGSFPDAGDERYVIAETPDAEDLIELAARSGYYTWTFRPARGGIWAEYAEDATLKPDGGREPPCPLLSILPAREQVERPERNRQMVYRLGRAVTH